MMTWMESFERFRELASSILSSSINLSWVSVNLEYIEFDGSSQYDTTAVTHFAGDHQDADLDVIPSVRRLEREAADLLQAINVDSEAKYEVSLIADRRETRILVEPRNEMSALVQFSIVASTAKIIPTQRLRGVARVERRKPKEGFSGHTKMAMASIKTLADLRALDDMDSFLSCLAEEEEMDGLAPLLASALEGKPETPAGVEIGDGGRLRISIDMKPDFVL